MSNIGSTTPADLFSQVAGDSRMRDILSERSAVAAWLRTEVALAIAEAELGMITPAARDAIAEAADPDRIDMARLWDETRVVGYPILPLIRQLDELLPEGNRGSVHLGATTQDIMDTGLVLQFVDASDYLISRLEELGDLLAVRAREHADTVMPARTHAMHAVPTTFGAKLATYLSEVTHHRARAVEARRALATLSLYGAGGTSAAYGAESSRLRRLVAKELDLHVDDVPWHVSRGRLAEWAQSWILVIGSSSRLAREVIDLSRNEIAEVAERSGHHRGASSTMPQKQNPITSEIIVGSAIIAGSLSAAVARIMEPGHERAAGEWHAEWFVLPTIASLAASALNGMIDLVEGLQVNRERMLANLEVDHGLILAEAYMMELAPELGRERAHDVVYEAAGIARAEDISLQLALERTVPPAHLASLTTVDHASYVGEAAAVVEVAIRAWESGKEPQ
jgi:3-carboxy-cis,cis-muconate cycloisomerase